MNLKKISKKGSQGICFLGKIKIQDFLKHHIKEKEGNIVNASGEILGKHKGLHNYTLGQRKGINVPSNCDNKFYVVVAKDFESNTLDIDFNDNISSKLFVNEVFVSDINWINKAIISPSQLKAKVRYRDELVDINFIPQEGNKAKVIFKETQRGLASVQVLALYDKNILLGGAFYCS